MIRSWLTATTAPLLALQTSSSFWMPGAGSLHAPAIDTLMRVSLLALTAAGILAQILLLAGLFLSRARRPRFSPAWRWVVAAVFAVCMVWMTVIAENLWSTIRLTHATPNALQVEVTGVQFQWYFRYPGADKTYGATKPDLVDAPGGNPLGLDPADPYSHDDVVSSILVLPVDQQAEIRLRAQDVIHGFFVPAMRVMQNATPGLPSHIEITPNRIGDYPILCSQLCGLGHYRMHGILRVISAEEYAAWTAQHQPANVEK
jgi:cytochrome c oxidase subunit II